MGNGRKSTGLKPEAVARGLERFRSVLHGQSLKLSKVRESIARTALTYEGHFSVDELVQVLHENGVQEAHQATVYRAVPLMVEAGLIQPALVSKADGQRYEASFEREHHDHLVCTSC
ncbi:MAG TPA: transcriptional repressor, partial [Polyangiaceae bacterium]|nr:transcriptional repressor [Polyangiaceae bacterium]